MADHDRLPAVIEGTVVERLVHAKRHPVVPAWIRDDVTRRAAAKYALLHTAHLAAFHGARSPKYLARTLAWSPRGLARVVAILARWAWDAETELLRSHAVTILLMFASVLIGAMPRMGETFALRVLALGTALDPLARLRVWGTEGHRGPGRAGARRPRIRVRGR
ncbi:MAG TPA: hypothetical protein DHU96_19620 [Actinobacteria bacterium]|nr:hypothetical protein [Actinomycetota bacterium]